MMWRVVLHTAACAAEPRFKAKLFSKLAYLCDFYTITSSPEQFSYRRLIFLHQPSDSNSRSFASRSFSVTTPAVYKISANTKTATLNLFNLEFKLNFSL